MNKIKSWIEKSNRKKSKCNCIIFTTNEDYEVKLAKTGHNFYAFSSEELKSWDDEEHKRPDNYFVLPKNEIPIWLNFDVIIVQHKIGQYSKGKQISDLLKIPMIVVEHSMPRVISKMEQQIDQLKSMRGHLNIFTSSESADAWGIEDSYVINSDPEEDFITQWTVLLEQFYERLT
tara:strand:+ start:4651 stop:5175 length:525 start_codon:yes stop_codon:yes gene_type:complete